MKAIVLAANYAYLNNTETAIKSIVYNNAKVKIYVFNYDIPQEWFVNVNQYIQQFGSEIVDQKFDKEILNKLRPPKQVRINKMAYARMLIPKYIPEDKVLYLDGDTIVDHSLDKLFSIDFDGNELLAVQDLYAESEINSGVIVFNNRKLKRDKNLIDNLLRMASEDIVENADQTVISTYFKGKIKLIPQKYNYQLGFDLVANMENNRQVLDTLDGVKNPVILHYLNGGKPSEFISYDRFRNKWWFYCNLSWPSIVQKHGLLDMTKVEQQYFDGEVLVFTHQVEIQNLEQLIKKLPNVHFNVAAYTDVAWKLKELLKYPNYSVFPRIISKKLTNLINRADVYLDINYGKKENRIINCIEQRYIPIFSFKKTFDRTNQYDNYHIFDNNDVEGMSQKIMSVLNSHKD